MRLIASSSFSAAIAASQAFLRIGTTTAVAKSVNVAYENQSQKQNTNESTYADEECLFVSSFNSRKVNADVGILLSCSDPEHICIEDRKSSLGGRCVSIESERRELQSTPTCTAKCTGELACEGLSQDFVNNNIGAGSCCGYKACVGVSGEHLLLTCSDSFVPTAVVTVFVLSRAFSDQYNWCEKLHRLQKLL
jgi:hypothetical protein